MRVVNGMDKDTVIMLVVLLLVAIAVFVLGYVRGVNAGMSMSVEELCPKLSSQYFWVNIT